MLDADTKRRIDTARDILVGKVPDPKSQVEQITIALIYKFMDDLDAESEELGWRADFLRWGVRQVRLGQAYGSRHRRVRGSEPVRRGHNANAGESGHPAFVPRHLQQRLSCPTATRRPYGRSSRSIDEFTYDHSERLGDAFEYLLSVLGAQGDAGQFRTPRHIIDFIVAVIDPKKDEVVLDPACGTAGFLISAYKHILAANTNGDGQSTLTPDARGRLVSNFKGYDISPDMVRLSLVNMYLHGFREPHIHEYDTLTSEDRWNEYADVILANPPFMSPKGGISPHNRFSIQSKRSEVLFVDYMAEHLTANGRAGVIVPEGIIFQSQTAYRQLRKMLVEDYLVAVVSLPAGVFKPYSGVKTSILILDRALAKRTDAIAFFNVENDGFDLGDQRRPIDKNDLPHVQAELCEYLDGLRAGESLDDCSPLQALIVEDEKIAADGEYGLSSERYRPQQHQFSNFELVPFESVCTLEYGASLPKSKRVDGPYPVMGSNGISGYHNEYLIEGPSVIVGRKGSAGEITYVESNCFPIDTTYYVRLSQPSNTNLTFVYFLLKSLNLPSLREGAGVPGLNRNDVYARYNLPLPPLKVQQEIVVEIDGYQKVIDGARAVVENYRPHFVTDPEWPLVSIQELAKPHSYGFTASAQEEGDTRFIRITDISEEGVLSSEEQKFIILTSDSKRLLLERGDVLVARTGATYGKTMLFDEDYPAVFASYLIRLRFPSEKVDPYFYWAFAQSDNYWNQARALMTGGGQPQFNGNAIKQVKLSLPPLSTQRSIVAELKTEQAVIESNRELIKRFEGKIQATVARVWGNGAPVDTGA